MALSVHQSIALRHRLTACGAAPALVNQLETAAEADYHFAQILSAARGFDSAEVPALGSVVLTHTMTEMITWPVTGVLPEVIVSAVTKPPNGRRGPVPAGPQSTAEQRQDFFTGLRQIADRTRRRVQNGPQALAHRQACYLGSVDATGESTARIGAAGGRGSDAREWTPRWADARSKAVARARRGDPEPLRAFIDAGAHDSRVGLASLNYHAYWVGEIPGRRHRDDFMIDPQLSWRGIRLLRHLADRITAEHGFVDLNVHALWLLLASRSGLGLDAPDTARRLARHSRVLLDEDQLSRRARQELSDILYSLRTMGMTP